MFVGVRNIFDAEKAYNGSKCILTQLYYLCMIYDIVNCVHPPREVGSQAVIDLIEARH